MKAMSHVNANPTSSTAIPCAATTCHHCHKAIEWDGRDSYRHLTGFYSCLELGGWNQATPEHEL